MKKTLFTFFWFATLVAFGTESYSQQKNTFSVVYGTGSDGLFPGGIGSAGYSSRGFTMFGLDYVHHLDGLFSIETGLEYSNNNLLWDYEDAYDPTFRPQKTSIKMLSVPVLGNFTFFKYLFLNAGFSVDLETDHEHITEDESGIGIFLGAGGKYTCGHVALFANPFFQMQGVLPFSPNGGRSLINTGFRFGIGYAF